MHNISSFLLFFCSRFAVCFCLVLCSISPGDAQNKPSLSDFSSDAFLDDPLDLLPLDLVEQPDIPTSSAPQAALPKPADAAPNVAPTPPAETPVVKTGAKPKPSSEELTTFLDVKDADIEALIKTFSRLTGRNYVIDSSVKGKVTIHLPTAVTISEALRILDSVLLLKGFTTVPMGNNIWKVVPAKDAKQTTIPLLLTESDAPTDALVTQLFRLKHVPADDLKQALSQFVSKDGLIDAFSGTNSLIIIDSASNIHRLTELLSELDVPAIDQDITIIPVVHAEASDVAEKVKQIIGEDEKDQLQQQRLPQRLAQQGIPGRVGGLQSATSSGSQRMLPIKIFPDERTNSVIIVADPELTARVRALIETLDSPVDLSGGRFYVYRLKHADAEILAGILSDITSGASTAESQKSTVTGSSISRSQAQRSTQENSSSSTDRLTQTLQQRALAARQFASQGAAGGSGNRVNFEGEVSIASDAATNSLIINASRSDYLKVKEVIDELDVKRRQVIVEATILEVSLNKDEGRGFELQGSTGNNNGGGLAQTNFGGLTNLFTNPAALSDLTIAAASTGTITLPGGITIPSQAVLVTALSSNQHVNVLSAPTILTTDNQEAEIIVGENVPFVRSTGSDPTNLNNTFNQIERQDVGITLRLTPQISTGEFVTLKIFVEISNVVPGTRDDPNGPTTTIRTTETTVEVKDSQMIVTGGLIADNVTTASRGVPFLKDIPVLGHLFRRDDESRRRTNLLVFLTPRILKDHYDARDFAVERRDEYATALSEYDTPQREEVLGSRNLDNVAEALPPGSLPAPSMITPPKTPKAVKENPSPEDAAALERTLERFEALSQGHSKQKPAPQESSVKVTDSEEVIEIQVTPRLPGESAETPAARPMLGAQAPAQAVSPPRAYVVLKDLSGASSTPSENVGINFADASGTLGLAILGTPESSGGTFFQVGRKYAFTHGDEKKEFVVLGKFRSPEEAAAIHPSLQGNARWQNLSPQETLLLGNGPWRQAP